MSVQIRPIQKTDEPAWRELWTGYLQFYNSTVAEAVYASTFQRFFADGAYEPRCLVAESGGRLVGIVHYMTHRHCWKLGDVCYLQDLFVAPDLRGTGAGRALIEAVYAEADRHGWENVYWNTQHSNEVGRRLYDRVGELTAFIKYQRPSGA